MTRNLKTLGLALVAALAMSAMAASAAIAESFAFHSELSHTTLVGGALGPETFTVDGGAIECEGTDFAGTASSKELTELAVTPKFGSCLMEPFATVDTTVNSCRYVLSPATKSGGVYKAKMSLACNGGDSMKIATTLAGVTKCTIDFPPQELGEVTISQAAEGDLKVVANITGIEYDQTAGTGLFKCSQAEKQRMAPTKAK